MKRYLVVAVVLALGLVFSASGVSLAQEEEETGYAWGTVTMISSNQIIVAEYDYDTDADTEVTYAVDSQVEIRNVDSLTDIAVGDSVEIDFVTSGSRKVAKAITVEETPFGSFEEEYVPSISDSDVENSEE